MNPISVSLRTMALLSACFLTLEMQAGERVVLSWENFAADSVLPVRLNESATLLKRGGSTEVKILTAETNPATPFADGQAGLQVRAEGESRVSVSVSPFTSPPLIGWIEGEFYMEENNIVITIGCGAPNPGELGNTPLYGGNNLANIFLRSQDTTLVVPSQQRDERMQIGPKILQGEIVRLRVSWDFSGEVSVVTFFINGEPALKRDGGEFQVFVDKELASAGIDLFRIVPMSGVIGKITASE